jgi:outer membrane protein insertion porin family
MATINKRPFLLFLVGSLAFFQVEAFQSFVVKTIRVEGLHRVSKGAVLEDLPVEIGQTITDAKATGAIRALYKSGFFKEVTLNRDGNALVVHVIERPTISKLTLTGIKDKDKVKKLLREVGLAEGQLFDPTVLLRAQKELERYYYSRGRYGVKIEPTVTEDQGSLVCVTVAIYEGDVARIKDIKLMGNTLFSEKELLKEFRTAKTNWLSWFSSDDKYNKEKLNADLETLRSYYMDRGYINFQIDSSQVSLSSDKKSIFITIHITEGEKYNFRRVGLTGQFVVPEKALRPLIEPLKAGIPFSRKTLLEVKQALEDRLGDEGFTFAEAHTHHEIIENKKCVDIVFEIHPGKRMSVRRILFKGNATTKDEVLRRELPQMEGTWISNALVREGKEKILRRGFASEIEVETLPVPGTSDELDVVYKVEEARLGQLGGGLGYSPTEKIMFNFAISQENFFGTGNAVDFNFDKSKAFTSYALGYMDPYFTVDGVGMGVSGYFNESNLSKTTNISNFTTDTLGGEVRWLFPIDKYEFIKFSAGYDNTRLKIDQTVAAQEIKSFVMGYGKEFREYAVGLAWMYESLNQRIFPTRGLSQSLGVKTVVPGANQQYYQLSYSLLAYHPLTESESWVVGLKGNLGYGSGYGKSPRLPFYRNSYAGGMSSVRGFEENSLGPKDSNGRSFGGNALALGTVSLIFPNPIKPDAKSVRTALFLDAGQVYDTSYRNSIVNGASRNPRGLRYAAGVSLTWNTPLGAPLSFSLAKPLNVKPGDEKRYFTFSMATQF